MEQLAGYQKGRIPDIPPRHHPHPGRFLLPFEVMVIHGIQEGRDSKYMGLMSYLGGEIIWGFVSSLSRGEWSGVGGGGAAIVQLPKGRGRLRLLPTT